MRLPLTILSGYLGAGKTTLLNRLLQEDHGLRLMALVNDFGAVNLDASTLEDAGGDVVELTNGCVCCNMDGDLFMALNAALDRDPRPDHLIVEASGIADPAAIAAAALVESEIGYGGIITLVDGTEIERLLDDPDIAPQVSQQIRAADLVLITKTDTPSETLLARLRTVGARNPAPLAEMPLGPLLFDLVPLPKSSERQSHPAYVSWVHNSDRVFDRAELGELLQNRPSGLYRLKGSVLTDDGAYRVHVVGQHVSARRGKADRTVVVGLGLADRLSVDELDRWWMTEAPVA